MHALLGLFLLIITLCIGYQNHNLFHPDALSAPKVSWRRLYLNIPLLPPWIQTRNLMELEEPRKILVLPEVVEPVSLKPGELSPPVSSPQPEKYNIFIKRYSSRYEVEPQLVRAVIRHESGFNAAAVSPKGAVGLMQLMPETATLMGVRNAFDAGQNIAGGVKYLKLCLNHFDQDVGLALAAYNAGPGNVKKYNGCPPFPETRKFVASVMEKCYGRDWPRKTRITLPDKSPLAKTDFGKAKSHQKASVLSRNHRDYRS